MSGLSSSLVNLRTLLRMPEESAKSDWVREEVEACFERESREKTTILCPIRLDDAVMNTTEAWAASIRRQRHIGDFRGWRDRKSTSEVSSGYWST
jgi:hypothetical protein